MSNEPFKSSRVNIHTDASNNIVGCNQLFFQNSECTGMKYLWLCQLGCLGAEELRFFPFSFISKQSKTVKEESFDRVDDWLGREPDILYYSHQF